MYLVDSDTTEPPSMVSHVVMLGWLGGYYRVELVDYAGGDIRGETIVMPFVRVRPTDAIVIHRLIHNAP